MFVWPQIHQELPPGVHTYPTLKGKKRFEILQVFNAVLGVYILLHKIVMPVAVYVSQTGDHPLEVGYWYLYHGAIAAWMMSRWRSPRTAFWTVYLAWFAMGYLPLMIVHSVVHQGGGRISWGTVSSLLCYGSSLVFTLFLLYRMRMPTTAYLFHLKDRIIPKWRYAVPYLLAGFGMSLFWFLR